jgi:hypothetical protein
LYLYTIDGTREIDLFYSKKEEVMHFNIDTATRHAIMSWAEVAEVWQFAMDKYTTAEACRATAAPDNPKFFLTSLEGSVRVIIFETGVVRLICNLPRLREDTVILDIGHMESIFYSHNPFDNADAFVAEAKSVIMAMEITSFPNNLYGFMHNASVVGFFLQSDYEPTLYDMKLPRVAPTTNIYLLDHPGVHDVFPFINELDPVVWWQHFWNYYFAEQIIPLSQHIMNTRAHIWEGCEEGRAWISISSTQPTNPDLLWEGRYWAWNPQEQIFFAPPAPPFPFLGPGVAAHSSPLFRDPLSWLLRPSAYANLIT